MSDFYYNVSTRHDITHTDSVYADGRWMTLREWEDYKWRWPVKSGAVSFPKEVEDEK